MAKGKTATIKSTENNKKDTLVTRVVELIVVNGDLVPDNNDVHPGVNSTTNKN